MPFSETQKMSLLSAIRRYAWNRSFAREYNRERLNRKIVTLNQAKRIGILFDASEESDYKLVADFVKSLQSKQKQVKALGYINAKEIPRYCIPMLSYDFYTSKNLNWYHKPSGDFINDFISTEYDLLLDLHMDESLQSLHIAACSQAFFKVGRFSEQNARFYDFMIDTRGQEGLQNYIHQITHYLNILNPQKHESTS